MVTGTVAEWEWVSEPMRRDPSESPFAWAVILLEDDTEIVAGVDAGRCELMRIGMRVRAEDEAARCFVPLRAA